VNLIFGVAGILSSMYLMSNGKGNAGSIAMVSLAALIGFMNSWFFFLVCNRGLNA